MQKDPAHGSKKVPPGQHMSHSEGFNAALDDALQKADAQWGDHRTDAIVKFVVDVETHSPGVIHEYKVVLDPTN